VLLRAAGLPRHRLRLRDSEEAFVRAAVAAGADPEAIAERIEAARREVANGPVAHRALEDARREWAVWALIARGRGG
jgi:hypothetical protein